jgi:hypothetical protein
MKLDQSFPYVLFVSGFGVIAAQTTHATDLDQLIPGLYGGQGIILPLVPNVPFSDRHVAHFQTSSVNALDQLNAQFATGLPQFPYNASAGSSSFVYDRDLGAYVNNSGTLGPIFAERSATVGRGKFTVSFSGTFFNYDTFNGQNINDIHVIADHGPVTPANLETNAWFNDKLDIGVDTKASVWILSPAVTVGITDNLDLSALLPIVNVDMTVNSAYHLQIAPGQDPATDPHSSVPGHDSRSGSATGIGDFVLEGKYRFYDTGPVDLAGALLTQFPTGDEHNFLGTGDYLVKPFLIASHTFANIGGSPLSLEPHVNLGYQFDVSNFDRLSAFDYAAGFDFGTRRISLAWEILGSQHKDGFDRIDTSIGLRWNFWKTFILSGNFILPLNDDGLRSDLVTTLGIEATF